MKQSIDEFLLDHYAEKMRDKLPEKEKEVKVEAEPEFKRPELKPMVSQTRNPDPEPFSFKFIGPGSPEAMKDAIASLRN